jgi:hypothetical protein
MNGTGVQCALRSKLRRPEIWRLSTGSALARTDALSKRLLSLRPSWRSPEDMGSQAEPGNQGSCGLFSFPGSAWECRPPGSAWHSPMRCTPDFPLAPQFVLRLCLARSNLRNFTRLLAHWYQTLLQSSPRLQLPGAKTSRELSNRALSECLPTPQVSPGDSRGTVQSRHPCPQPGREPGIEADDFHDWLCFSGVGGWKET